VKARTGGTIGDTKGACYLRRRIVLERRENEKGGIRGLRGTERSSHLFVDAVPLHLLQGHFTRAVRRFSAWRGSDQRSITAKAARKVSSQVRGGDQEPGQHGAVDHPYGLSTAPELEERCGGYVFRIVDVGGDPKSMAVDAVAVLIKDGDESIGISRERRIPGPRFVPT
jgi:hypothetical protein